VTGLLACCATLYRETMNVVLQLRSDYDIDVCCQDPRDPQIRTGGASPYQPCQASPTSLHRSRFTPSSPPIDIVIMVKNGPNSLRNSTSNLSLRPTPSETELNAAARQRMADLEARIAQMKVGHEGRARSSAAEPSAPLFYPSPEQSRALQANIDARSGSRVGESSALSLSFYPSPEQSRALQADVDARSGPRVGESSAPSLSFYPSPEQSRALQADIDAGSGSRAAGSISPFPRVSYPGIPKSLEALRTYRDCGYAYPQHSTGTTYPAPPPHFFPPPLPCPSRMSAPFGALSPWAERDVPANKETPEKSLFEKYNESLQEQHNKPKGSLITKGLVREGNALKSPEAYTQPFCDFLTENPTVWHAVAYFEKKLEKAGFKKVCHLDQKSEHP